MTFFKFKQGSVRTLFRWGKKRWYYFV